MRYFSFLPYMLFFISSAFSSSYSYDDASSEEDYLIPVTIGITGDLAAHKSTNSVMVEYPNKRVGKVFNNLSKRAYEKRRFYLPALSSCDFGRSVSVYYPTHYIFDESENKQRFRTEIMIPFPEEDKVVEKIRLHASSPYSIQEKTFITEGRAELIYRKEP